MPPEEKHKLVFPADLRLIDSVETLKVVADPLRLRLLALLRREPATAKELARALGTPLKKLYYHIGLLEEHGLIRVRGTRVVSGIIEKQYEVTAYRLSIDRGLLASAEPAAPGGLEVFLSFVLDHAHAEIQKSIEAGLINPAAPTPEAGGLSLGRVWMRLSPEQLAEYERRSKELYMEFARRQPAPDEPGAQYYEILLGVYPVVAPPDGGQGPGGEGQAPE